MGHLKISFPEILDGNIVIQDSIFNLTELFLIMFKKMADCLPRSPSQVNVPSVNVSLLFPLSLLYLSYSILFFTPSSFSFHARLCPGREASLVILQVQRGLTTSSASNLMLYGPFAIVCSWIDRLSHPSQF